MKTPSTRAESLPLLVDVPPLWLFHFLSAANSLHLGLHDREHILAGQAQAR